MRVRYTATAHDEAEQLFSHIAKDNPAAAAAVIAAIKATVTRLGSFPRAGVLTDKPGVYAILAWPYRYLIFYQINGTGIIIRNIRHPARRHPF